MRKPKVTKTVYDDVKQVYVTTSLSQGEIAEKFRISKSSVWQIINSSSYEGYKDRKARASRANYYKHSARKATELSDVKYAEEDLKPLLAPDDAPTVMVAQIKYAQIDALKLLMDTMGIECQFMVK